MINVVFQPIFRIALFYFVSVLHFALESNMTYGCHQNPTEENALITEECVRISESILTLKMSLYLLQRNEFFVTKAQLIKEAMT